MKLPRPSRFSQVSARSFCSVFRQADQFQRQLGVVERRAPRQQPVLLEHGGDLARGNNRNRREGFCRRYGCVPSVGGSSPIIMSKKVDLPQPVWPTIATTSRGAIVRSSRSMATTAWPDVACRNILRRPRTSIGGGPFFGDVHARHRSSRVSTRATTASSMNSSATSTMVQANTSATENNSCATDN